VKNYYVWRADCADCAKVDRWMAEMAAVMPELRPAIGTFERLERPQAEALGRHVRLFGSGQYFSQFRRLKTSLLLFPGYIQLNQNRHLLLQHQSPLVQFLGQPPAVQRVNQSGSSHNILNFVSL